MNEDTQPIDHPVSVDGRTAAEASGAVQGARGDAATHPLPEDALIILPVRTVVMFPGAVVPLTVGRERSRVAAQEAVRLERPLGVLLQSKPDVVEPDAADLHWVGSSAAVIRYVTTPDGAPHATARGLRLLPQVPEEMVAALQGVDGAAKLADFISGLMDVSAEEKQALLETFDLKARLDKLLELLARRIEVLKVSREIDERTRESITDTNRKHLLREQLRTIQKELGEGDESGAEIAELDKAITDAQMPEEVEKAARKELKRLERMPEAAGEYSMVRTYLEWLIELPWRDEPQPAIDIAGARRILDEDHFGLDKIKR